MEEHKDERFFLYVQSVDPHTTYDVPEPYWSKYYKGKYNGKLGSSFDREEQVVVDNGKLKISDDDLAWIWAVYNGEVTYQDHYLGGLLQKIEELGLAEDTLIVITNDHGEEIREHGGMGHGWPLFEEQIRAPLLMSFPPLFKPGRNIKTIVEHADLAPTILDALGVPPMKSAEGLSFLPFIEDGVGKRQHPFYTVAWSRKGTRSVRVGDWKLIAGKTSGWMNLYNLGDDPKELKNLLKKGKDPEGEALLPGRLCEVYLSETLATPDKAKRLDSAGQKQRYNSQEIPIDDKTRKELEALGYL
jgi:arylsulfatase A-like enzyme